MTTDRLRTATPTTDVSELLHAGALAASVVGTCCVAASGPRTRVWEFVLAVVMLAAMTDVVLGLGLLAPVWWAAVILLTSMLSIIGPHGRRTAPPSVRRAHAMDALGGILMAALLVLMSGGAVSAGEHAGHGVSSTTIAGAVVAASVLFAGASVHMAVTMRMPRPAAPVRLRVLRRTVPLSMGVSVLLMAALVVV